MKILTHDGSTYSLAPETQPQPPITLSMWLGKNGKFTKKAIQARLDTGCIPGLWLPIDFLPDLRDSLSIVIEPLDQDKSFASADASVEKTMTVLLDVRLKSSSGSIIEFLDLPVTLSETSEVILLGLGVLTHLDLVIKNGKLVLLQLSDPVRI